VQLITDLSTPKTQRFGFLLSALVLTIATVLPAAAQSLESQGRDPANPAFDADGYRRAQLLMPVLLENGETQVEPDWAEGPAPPAIELEAPPLELFEAGKAATAPVPNRRYDEVRQKSSHNSFQKQEAILDQMIYHRIRSLELDIHHSKGPDWPITPQDWYVYHDADDDWETTCHRLSDCLDELRSFHDAYPQHEVVTVFLDLKDDWRSGVDPWDLDLRIDDHMPSSMLYRPIDLAWRCGSGSLQTAASTCGWPFLRDLRGKFIFALTGDIDKLDEYVLDGAQALFRTAFVAPKLKHLDLLDDQNHNYAVFFNMETDHQDWAANVGMRHFISRSYYVNDEDLWNDAESFGVNHLATDKINFHQDVWSRTHNAQGWPFECFSPCASGLKELDRTLGVEVDSKDIWDSSDNFRFLYEYTGPENKLWTTAVNTRNSHTEDWAKGCLMARSTLSSDSPYFAVCRPNDDYRLRIQWRYFAGGPSDRTDADVVPSDTIDEESITHIGLLTFSDNRCVAGYGSQDGATWSLIGYKCFSVPLNRQGLASSSHEGGTIKFLYTNVEKNGVPYYLSTFPFSANVGTVWFADAFDGVFP
jgi:Phosphoinositide phospholipase C, Ca2+-dependent